MNTEQERAAFEAWLGVKPCGAAHDFAWEAWRGRAAQEDSEDKWRDLALQFDGHRMQALAWLKQILAESPADAWPFARTFLKSPPMSGEAVLAERIEELAAHQSQDREDAERYRWLRNESWAGYNQSKGKPQVAETIVFVQDGAGNVKTILAEDALDAAIDAAMEKQHD